MTDDVIKVDIAHLREALVDEAGAAAFMGLPFAAADAMALESADPAELLAEAERRGWDLRDFEV